MKKLRVCMVTHNRPLCSIMTLESLISSLKHAQLSKEDCDIWIYDDKSEGYNSDKVLNYSLQCKDYSIKYIRSEKNVGSKLLRGRHIQNPETLNFQFSLFIDNDVLFVTEAIDVLFNLHKKLSKATIAIIGERSWKAYTPQKAVQVGSFSYIVCRCNANGLGGAMHFGFTGVLKKVGYHPDDSDWEWNPRALKKKVVLYFLLGDKNRRPVEHIPTLLKEKKLITQSEETKRFRSWQGNQKGRFARCGDLNTKELIFLRRYSK